MPETLQKLHESSKSLETNQTAISQKIYEVQQRIETVEKEVSQMSFSFILCVSIICQTKFINLFLMLTVFTVKRQHPKRGWAGR